jgi:MFS family permease
LGLSLGLGLPSSMAFLSDSTTIEERGRVAGLTILEAFVVAFLSLAILEILELGTISIIILVTIIRSISFLALIVDKNEQISEKEKPRFTKNDYREFVFYLIPWIMFVVAASIASNVITAYTTDNSIPNFESYESVILIGNVFRYAFIAIFGFVSGIVIDRIGRKQSIIIGLIALGIGFGLLGFEFSETTILLYFMASGIAWGSFLTVFLVIPGDLSIFGSREMFYAFGTIGPLIILFSFSMIDTAWLTDLIRNISASSVSQILSIILFVSIVPVIRAKETLSESKKRKRKMKKHIDSVGKLLQDYKK